MPLCPDSPLCATVDNQKGAFDRIVDCYCAVPEAGTLRHVRRLLSLRKAHFAGVVRGPDAAADDYKEKPLSGGGHTLGLTGPIVDVPVSLRSARSLRVSPDGRTLTLTLESGTVLSFSRDPKTGELHY